MRESRMKEMKIGMKAGAAAGVICFLVFGIAPAFHYGGYGTLLLLGKIAGGPLDMTLGVRMIMILGVLLGMMCLASMSIVLGSMFGTGTGYLVSMAGLTREPAVQPELAD